MVSKFKPGQVNRLISPEIALELPLSETRWRELPLETLRRSLLDWYAQWGRDLPWRRTTNPYAIWVSEVMLQQTQVKTVLPYYERWLDQFPTVHDLAAANQQDVLMVWQGLGYYARARNLHRAAQIIGSEYGGQVPNQMEDLLKLPSIGRTTAGGILSSAFHQPWPILDGNVKRVLARLIGLTVPPKMALSFLWTGSETLLDRDRPKDFNQALMDLGATICTAKQPVCTQCPWSADCQAYQFNLQSVLPMSESTAPLPHKTIGVAVIWNAQGQVLIDKRPQNGLLGGLWEFPGGKVEPNETIVDCIAREIQEELGMRVEVLDHLITVEHAYTHFKVTLTVHHCRHLGGEPQAIACDEIKWVDLADLDQYPFPTANQKIIAKLRENGIPS
ncbi:MAG: A/G-specific adenine glycosylase [Thermosynechococcaceae cyanobacterium]